MVNEEAFWSHVHKQDGDDGHWLWTGAKNSKGYGILGVDGQTVRAHRVSYEMEHGAIPDGKVVGHKTRCATTSCIRPSHLELVTNDENVTERVRREAKDVTIEFLSKMRELLSDLGQFTDDDLGHVLSQARAYAGGVLSGKARRERAAANAAEPDIDDVHVPGSARTFPYKERGDLPEAVRGALPAHAQDVFMAAYNGTINEDASNEAQAAAIAWAAVKKAGYAKGDDGKWRRQATEFVAARADGRRFAEVLWEFMAPPDWVQVLPKPGRYSHPVYGAIDLDADALREFVANFEAGVYNQDAPVALDFEHDKGDLKEGGAVGYIEALRPLRDYRGGVEAKVRWTERGKEALESDAYRYFSPEWYETWKQAASGKTFRNVLIGGALTTRPFFKADAMRPLTATEDGQWQVYEAAESKTEDGIEWGPDAYLVVPDPGKSSTWKLRIQEVIAGRKEVTRAQLGRAAAALGPGGFRGQPVELTPDERRSALSKLRGLYARLGVKPDEMPAHIQAAMRIQMKRGAEMVIKLTEEQAALVAEGKAIELTEEQTAELAPRGASEETARRFTELEGQLRTATEQIATMRGAESQRWADEFVSTHRHAVRGEPKDAAERLLAYRREMSEATFGAYCADLDGIETALSASEMFAQRSSTRPAATSTSKLDAAVKKFTESGMPLAEARLAAMQADPSLYDEANNEFMADLKARGV